MGILTRQVVHNRPKKARPLDGSKASEVVYEERGGGVRGLDLRIGLEGVERRDEGRHHLKPAGDDAALGDHRIRDRLQLGGWPLHQQNFQCLVVHQMDVQGRDHFVDMPPLERRQARLNAAGAVAVEERDGADHDAVADLLAMVHQ